MTWQCKKHGRKVWLKSCCHGCWLVTTLEDNLYKPEDLELVEWVKE